MDAQQQHAIINNYLLVAVLKKLDALGKTSNKIDRKVGSKTSVLMASDALALYHEHLSEGVSKRGRQFKVPENYSYVLECFAQVFGKRNIALIQTEEIAVFLQHFWATASTQRQRRNELSAFFSWCIKLLQKRRKPVFVNPCSLLDPIAVDIIKPEFHETTAIRELIDSAVDERQWLTYAILATAGLRVSEMLGILKEEVNGQILTLHRSNPNSDSLKSDNSEEIAVIPAYVAKRLSEYSKCFVGDDRLFDVHRVTVYKGLQVRGQHPHGLRKWCITFWDRHNDPTMERFVRRHSSAGLRERYVAPLTAQEAIKRIRVMENQLWKK